MANQFVDKLSIFDPRRGGVTDTIADLHGPKDVAVGFGAAWVALATDRSVIRIDAGTKANQRIAAGTSVALGPKAVWVADGAKVVPIDPETLHAGTPITLRFTADQLAIGDDGTVWATHTADDAVSRIDAADGSVQTIENVGRGPTGIAVGEGAAWVAVSDGRALVRIDLGSRRVDRQIPLGSSPGAVAVADGHVWVTTQAASG